MTEQVQCCLQWPGEGLNIDTMRLVSIEMPEWEDLTCIAREQTATFPRLSVLVAGELPISMSPDDITTVAAECDEGIDWHSGDLEPYLGMVTLLGFLRQALEQPGAHVRLEHWPGDRFEEQIFIQPGVDLHADLVGIDDMDPRGEERPDVTDQELDENHDTPTVLPAVLGSGLFAVAGILLARYGFSGIDKDNPLPWLTTFYVHNVNWGFLIPVLLLCLVGILKKCRLDPKKTVGIVESCAIVTLAIWWGGCFLAWFMARPLTPAL